ncbi:MAG: hypothetical protein L3J71_03605 [Victivallaceae bacterium]|nr:hypothetical protein [Victivallaceae bacterium]
MATFIVCIIVFFVALFAVKAKWNRGRVVYETEFLKKRNEFLKIAGQLEEKLLNSTVVNGDMVHDHLFKVIHYVKYRESYVSLLMAIKLIFYKENSKTIELREKFNAEIEASSIPVKALSKELINIYRDLIIMRHWKMFLIIIGLTAFKLRQPIVERQAVEPTLERVVAYSATA